MLVIYVDEGIEFVLIKYFVIKGCHPVLVNMTRICLILIVDVVVKFRRYDIIKCLIQVLIVNISQIFDLFFNRLGII